ncbi:HigA family addiction module antitoxin [Halomonas sp. YLGW01]|uniref:HigA family addiction module antitoxin n=1 Tax=Halomonas sp. YLGW01 TaxID=2773308 RepID=UPI001781718D|nr:HigA family addiction module antitoxin [Halomonas sp. YLGW01]
METPYLMGHVLHLVIETAELCRNKRAVTADTALMFSRVFGNTAQFWLSLQQKMDIWEATHDAKRLERIEKAQPLERAR